MPAGGGIGVDFGEAPAVSPARDEAGGATDRRVQEDGADRPDYAVDAIGAMRAAVDPQSLDGAEDVFGRIGGPDEGDGATFDQGLRIAGHRERVGGKNHRFDGRASEKAAADEVAYADFPRAGPGRLIEAIETSLGDVKEFVGVDGEDPVGTLRARLGRERACHLVLGERARGRAPGQASIQAGDVGKNGRCGVGRAVVEDEDAVDGKAQEMAER